MTRGLKYWLLYNTVNGINALEAGEQEDDRAVARGAAGNVPLWNNRKEGNYYVVPYEIEQDLGK